MSDKSIRTLSRIAAALGTLCLFVAVFANVIGISEGAVGRPRWILGIVGAVLLLIGLLRRKFFSGYKAVAILGLNTVVLLLCLEGAATLLNRYVLPSETDVAGDPAMLDVAHTRSTRATYVEFMAEPFSGEYVNIDQRRLRVTPFTASEGQEPIDVFAFGGSTMWGEGASDDQTIPAYLQSRLTKELNHNVRVTNFGQRAWVATQSLIQLTLELSRGNVPDVVVFYDGFNEVHAYHATAKPGVPEPFGTAQGGAAGLLNRSALVHLFKHHIQRQQSPEFEVDDAAAKIITNYNGVIDVVRQLGKQYGFATRFYWQPQFIDDPKPLTPEEAKLVGHAWQTEKVVSLMKATYANATAVIEAHDDLVDLRDAFAAINERVYIDPAHVRSVGNKRVADLMLERGLLETVRDLQSLDQLHDER